MQNDQSSNPNSNRSLMWVLAVLGGLIVVLLVILFFLLVRRGSAPAAQTPLVTDTAQPSPTFLLPTWTPVPPTETPTSVPTEAIPTPTPISGDPAAVLGRPSGVDTFDNANNWTLFDSDCFKSEIKGGMYVMTAKGQQGVSCWEVTWPSIQNFYLQTDVQSPDSCQPDDRFGILFRAPDNLRGYLYGLTCDGRYTLTAWDGNATKVLVDLTSNPAIKGGTGQLNRIGVLADGSYYALYANGIQLSIVQDSSFTDAGKIGYFVRAASTSGFSVKFDNLSVWLFNQGNVGSEGGFLPGIVPTPAPVGLTPIPVNPTAIQVNPTAIQVYPTYVSPAFTATPTPKFVSDIVGPAWYLTRYTASGGSETAVQDPDKYWLKLNPNGTVSARGDCNTASGTYTLKGEKLTIDLTGGTSETCATGSFSDQYFSLLEDASTYSLSGNKLVINLSGGGNLRFTP